jgi:hypothetical protein
MNDFDSWYERVTFGLLSVLCVRRWAFSFMDLGWGVALTVGDSCHIWFTIGAMRPKVCFCMYGTRTGRDDYGRRSVVR